MTTNYINWKEYQAKSVWHNKQAFYGKAFHIKKKYILTAIIILCAITPFTNWVIPIASKIIKTGITIRWG